MFLMKGGGERYKPRVSSGLVRNADGAYLEDVALTADDEPARRLFMPLFRTADRAFTGHGRYT